MEFEFDPGKSERNKKKHGMDFVEAQALWSDPEWIEIPARTVDEARFLVVGKIGDRHWSGIVAYRGGTTRIISVHPANRKEVEAYES